MFSAGKSIAAIVTSLMVDRGFMEYEEKVCTYWPEFGQNGKDKITVADVLRHEAGLAHIKDALNIYDILRDNIKDNAIGQMIEKCEPYFPTNNFNSDGTVSQRSYHSVSRGWILNELVRRVCPEGRTIGEILRQDVNIEGVHCGLNDREMKIAVGFKFVSPLWVLAQSLLPERFGRKIDYGVWDFIKKGIAHGIVSLRLHDLVRHISNLRIMSKPQFEKKSRQFYIFDPFIYGTDTFVRGENPGASCNGSARGMSRLASTMANKGVTPEGEMLITDKTWEKMHGEEKMVKDGILGRCYYYSVR